MPFPSKSNDQDDPVTARKNSQRSEAEATVRGNSVPSSQPPQSAPAARPPAPPELAGQAQQPGFTCPGCGLKYDITPTAPEAPQPEQPQGATPQSPMSQY